MTHSRLPNFSRLVSGGAEEAGMKGRREHAADVFTDQGARAAKMKSASGPSDFQISATPPLPTPPKGGYGVQSISFVVRINSRGEMPTILRKDFENADEELKP